MTAQVFRWFPLCRFPLRWFRAKPFRASQWGLVAVLSAGFLGSCRDSATVGQISGFADRVCACQDAACAKQVETDFLKWKNEQKRARGTEDDRKAVETAMQRYAGCHLALLPSENVEKSAPAMVVPKVNLSPPIKVPSAKVPSATTPVEHTGESGRQTP